MNYKKLDEFIKYLEDGLEKGSMSIIDIPKECIDEITLCKLMKGTGKLNRVIGTDYIRMIGSNNKNRVKILLEYCKNYKNLKFVLDTNSSLSFNSYKDYVNGIYDKSCISINRGIQLIIPKCFVDQPQSDALLYESEFTITEDRYTIRTYVYDNTTRTRLVEVIDKNIELCNKIKELDICDYMNKYFPVSTDTTVYLPTEFINEDALINLSDLYSIDENHLYNVTIMKVDGLYVIFNTNPSFIQNLKLHLINTIQSNDDVRFINQYGNIDVDKVSSELYDKLIKQLDRIIEKKTTPITNLNELREYMEAKLTTNQNYNDEVQPEQRKKEIEFIEKIRANRTYEIRDNIRNKIEAASYISDSCLFNLDELTTSDVTTLVKNGFIVKRILPECLLVTPFTKHLFKVIWNIENNQIADKICDIKFCNDEDNE